MLNRDEFHVNLGCFYESAQVAGVSIVTVALIVARAVNILR